MGTEIATAYDVQALRADFPILSQSVHGRPLVYLDNAATAQKPQAVIDALTGFYAHDCANIHRSVHLLGERATAGYEKARESVRRFLNAGSEKEIIFTRGATESINLVANTFGLTLNSGDEVVVTGLEHHSNIVPWQLLRERRGIVLRVCPLEEDGSVRVEELERLLSPRTRLVSVAHISNALGTVLPLERIIALAHARGIPVLVDAAQSAPHFPLDVQRLDCDFLAFSGHKVYGPTGIGVLYGKQALLDAMPPFQGGGDMIRSVSFEETLYNTLPYKFEAGTPHIAGAIGLGAAVEYLMAVGLERVQAHERDLLAYGTERLRAVPGLRIIGTAPHKAGVISFVFDGIHPHDVATILDTAGVAVRAGHHCAQPVMDRFGIPATTRASFALYNTREEIDVLAEGLRRVQTIFA